MSFVDFMFRKPYPRGSGEEVERLLEELITIGIREDYLSETPGRGYNSQCRHIRTREIGKKFNEIGGKDLLSWAFAKVRKKAGKVAASHLEYAWSDIGGWQA